MTDENKKPTKKVGRKRIDIDLAEVEKLAARGLGSTQIARALGVSWSTIDRNRKRSAEFDEVIKRGQARGVQLVTDALLNSATEGNVTAQIFYLKNRDSDRWKDRTDVNVGVKVSIKDAMEQARLRGVSEGSLERKTIDVNPRKGAENKGKLPKRNVSKKHIDDE